MRTISLALMCFLVLGCQENYDVPNHTPGVVKVANGLLMTAYGEGGLVISDENTEEIVAHIFPPREMNSIDDFDVEGELIFVLDSRGKDYVAVFSLKNSLVELVNAPVSVEGGPFNGISAANGNLVVAGGTTFLNRFRYNLIGELSKSISFGRDRGHPNVLLSEDGQAAFISTDFGIGLDIERFGVLSLNLGNQLEIPFVISEFGIAEAGFTTGVTTPVGFPIKTAIYQDNLLVAHGGGLTIIQLLASYAFGSDRTISSNISATAIAVDGDNAYLVGYENDTPTLLIYDLSDLSNPNLVDSVILNTDGNVPTSIAIGTNNVFIAAGHAGILEIPKN